MVSKWNEIIQQSIERVEVMDWTQTLSIIASLVGITAWLDYKHRQDMEIMRQDMKNSDERWKWLFDWAHYEVNDLKLRHPTHEKK